VYTHKERCTIPVSWKEGDTVSVNGKLGEVIYVYTNGYTCVRFPGQVIVGGVLNNNSTYGNENVQEVCL